MIEPIENNTLPPALDLNISALSALFRHTTNSYKFVFFLALLDLLKRHRFDAERPYTYDELTVEMLVIAWYPHTFFKLSFGTQDTIAQKLDGLELDLGSANHSVVDHKVLRAALEAASLKEAGRLMEFVPYRLLAPFLGPHLQGVDRSAWMVFERAMPAITNAHFETVRPLYRFDSDDYQHCSAIRWHPAWVAYLEQHWSIIKSWAAWCWLHYMQRRNPTTPSLSNKLFPPAKREALTKQTKYWRGILEQEIDPPLTCIYSGEPLTAASFALDHYLPWSFVVHDQLWNLIPTPSAVNSAKSNRLPSVDYLPGFVSLQHRGLLIACQLLGEARFGKVVEDYLADLHLPSLEALLDFDQLQNAFARTLGPLLTLATNQGFIPDWHYRSLSVDPMTASSVVALPHPMRLEAATDQAADSQGLGHAHAPPALCPS
ncbi:hypothetical protein MARPU_06255 [Marichromatium purpuratum 984]|uniref:HNH nuclease domain-containing protein n=1 Tax=Marichromatium purpuratum 984 TaxID=765910 RepID=W0E2Q6_MARPU|nr:HNH endonuclease domain-containing protein [Marichromatium purpuratum]AHF03509.1 hypothetical protein MARPU_06255 [Marichromatium purpuratum 984]